jgi:hypothetical protein
MKINIIYQETPGDPKSNVMLPIRPREIEWFELEQQWVLNGWIERLGVEPVTVRLPMRQIVAWDVKDTVSLTANDLTLKPIGTR